ncbi:MULTISPECIES: flavin monoamine oxidase family protein [Pseudomonas]|uniref:flavin monoamine oxidase family protein n=1 Tax=Pseudomonas TaxID=286 RepID=UPI0013DFDCB3|nr:MULTISPECIES: FAD-dependent oxidoreductase [Pseudomonas]MCE0911212.1 FAD-dependent oxidoreductase [Pseudomonas kurunegalensis]QIG17399.1 FAD-dependent oxidoreductase [Pseudomonas monteilii]QIG22656.1 FAD-dependent oxidoreductase [Pseudomonas monteilii]WJR57146.1 FAD-dependent oxidoreductase [Pseudomonas kurunegalensis]
MTIGSTHNHPADLAIEPTSPLQPWAARFPNPPDLCFDYRRLIEQEGGVAYAAKPEHRICIVGAGVTGLTAARELFRCGYTRITLMEQSQRVGGRHLTVVNHKGNHKQPLTPFEMGAMRMPLFNRTGESPKDGRSLMAYYAKLFELRLSDFPNPGTPWVNATGIYLRDGQLDGEGEPKLLVWCNPQGNTPPPTATLQNVYEKWHRFARQFAERIAIVYGTERWTSMWQAVVERYHQLSFRDLVHLPTLDVWDPANPGDFGGLGMNSEESAIFYAIGIGDGSWGAFYDVCCLYPLRTAIFGFSSHLQLVHGRVDQEGTPYAAPYLEASNVPDSRGLMFKAPAYIGLAAMDESLLFLDAGMNGISLYDYLLQRDDGLLTDTSVCSLQKLDGGGIRVGYRWHNSDSEHQRLQYDDFDSVILTLPSWLIETNIRLEGFSRRVLPPSIVDAWKHAHWETSCKVYAPLKKSFLDRQPALPQILVTDSFVHDVYAYRYNDRYTDDCILLSYTWEDDAMKLAAFTDEELASKCLEELDRILLRCSNVTEPISPYIDTRNIRIQRWATDKNALGCAKLYRAGTYYDAVGLMKYNRDYSASSGLYLAGESFSVDAGWTEPCLRTALDAVINLCNNTSATFNGGFTLEHYPHYQLGK